MKKAGEVSGIVLPIRTFLHIAMKAYPEHSWTTADTETFLASLKYDKSFSATFTNMERYGDVKPIVGGGRALTKRGWKYDPLVHGVSKLKSTPQHEKSGVVDPTKVRRQSGRSSANKKGEDE